MKTFKYFIFFIVLVVFFSSCGTTYVVVQYPDAEIYKNGKFIGKNVGEMTKYGLPGKAKLEARFRNQVIGQCEVSRKFNENSVVFGLFTYGVGFIVTAFKYPGYVIVPLNPEIINTDINKKGVMKSVWGENYHDNQW